MREDKNIELEMKVLHLENQVDQMSGVLYEQQKKVDRLEAALQVLANKMKEGLGQGPEIRGNEKPPHY